MVDFQTIKQSDRISDYKPELPATAHQDLGPSGDPKQFSLDCADDQGQEAEIMQKIFESIMLITLQQTQHSADQAMHRQKEARRNG